MLQPVLLGYPLDARPLIDLPRFTLIFILFLLSTIAPIAHSFDKKPAALPWPTADWSYANPESQGMNSSILFDLVSFIESNDIALHSLLVIRNGYMVLEEYFGSHDAEERHLLYSCTKSFISSLIGIAIDEGRIESVESPVLEFFPDRAFENKNDWKEQMTIHDLLSMQAGLQWNEMNTTEPNMRVALEYEQDWVKYVLDQPMNHEPGTCWEYSSGASHVLSAIITSVTGNSTLDYANAHLFAPLGIDNVWWQEDPNGINIGGYGIGMTSQDMARFGLLYLENGSWDGREIISSDWIVQSQQPHAITDFDGESYGYQFWVHPTEGYYAASGSFGQKIAILPEYNLVLVYTANLSGGEISDSEIVTNWLIPSIEAFSQTNDLGYMTFLILTITMVALVVILGVWRHSHHHTITSKVDLIRIYE